MGRKITELTAVSGLRSTDVIHLVDTKDPTMAITGTNKIITIGNFVPELLLQMPLIPSSKITGQAVTTEKIALSAITTDKIALSAVTTDRINNGAVTTDKIALSAVTTDRINNGAVTTDKIALSAVTQAKIATNVVGKGATFLAFKNESQDIVGNVYTQITSINNIAFNTDSGFSGATSTFTASVAGYYLFMGILQSSGASASNNFQASIWINNADNILGGQINNGTNPRTTVEGIRYLSAGSTVTLKAIASSEMTINLAEFSGCLIRSA